MEKRNADQTGIENAAKYSAWMKVANHSSKINSNQHLTFADKFLNIMTSTWTMISKNLLISLSNLVSLMWNGYWVLKYCNYVAYLMLCLGDSMSTSLDDKHVELDVGGLLSANSSAYWRISWRGQRLLPEP